jgi:Fe-S-cluster containining protein
MDQAEIDLVLKNYTALLKRVDAHIQKVEKDYSDKIACKKGCDSCCRFLSLFPVEAFAMSAAFLKMDKSCQDLVRSNLDRIEPEKGKEDCPLLIHRECVLYEARPIICRTHGFPIYIEKNGENLVDFCPKNFKGMKSFSKDALLNLEQLNTLLTAINTQFLESIETHAQFLDRIPMSKALFILSDPSPGNKI